MRITGNSFLSGSTWARTAWNMFRHISLAFNACNFRISDSKCPSRYDRQGLCEIALYILIYFFLTLPACSLRQPPESSLSYGTPSFRRLICRDLWTCIQIMNSAHLNGGTGIEMLRCKQTESSSKLPHKLSRSQARETPVHLLLSRPPAVPIEIHTPVPLSFDHSPIPTTHRASI